MLEQALAENTEALNRLAAALEANSGRTISVDPAPELPPLAEEPPVIEEATPEAAPEPGEEVSQADVLAALTNYSDEFGRDALILLLKRFVAAGAKPIFKNVPKTSYAAVIEAAKTELASANEAA
ncbi:MAG: hypothetical protein AAFX52_08705 [Pseudomonadota bacterium]